MNLFIFKTNVEPGRKLLALKRLFQEWKSIQNWTIDVEDIDRVLRVFVSSKVSEREVIRKIQSYGIQCERLSD